MKTGQKAGLPRTAITEGGRTGAFGVNRLISSAFLQQRSSADKAGDREEEPAPSEPICSQPLVSSGEAREEAEVKPGNALKKGRDSQE